MYVDDIMSLDEARATLRELEQQYYREISYGTLTGAMREQYQWDREDLERHIEELDTTKPQPRRPT